MTASKYFAHLEQGVPTELDNKNTVIKYSGKDYLMVHPRLQWFHKHWAPIIEHRMSLLDDVLQDGDVEKATQLIQQGVKPEVIEAMLVGNSSLLTHLASQNGYKIETTLVADNWVPEKPDQTRAVFKCVITDPIGNVATGHGMETMQGFKTGYLEKAETIAIGRALILMGFGTMWMDGMELFEGGEHIADSPVERQQKQATTATQPVAKPDPERPAAPVAEPTSTPATAAPAPTAPAAKATNTPITEKNQYIIGDCVVKYPKFLAWVRGNKFENIAEFTSNEQIERLKNNLVNWLEEFKKYLASHDSSLEKEIAARDALIAKQKIDVYTWAEQSGFKVTRPAPQSVPAATAPQYPDDTAEDVTDESDLFDEEEGTSDPVMDEIMGRLEKLFPDDGTTKIRPTDPESPTQGQFTHFNELVKALGGPASVGSIITELGLITSDDKVRPYEAPGVKTDRPNPRTCWTVEDLKKITLRVEQELASRGQQQAAA